MRRQVQAIYINVRKVFLNCFKFMYRRWKMGLFYGWYESTNTASGLHIRQRKELEQ